MRDKVLANIEQSQRVRYVRKLHQPGPDGVSIVGFVRSELRAAYHAALDRGFRELIYGVPMTEEACTRRFEQARSTMRSCLPSKAAQEAVDQALSLGGFGVSVAERCWRRGSPLC